MAYQEVLWQNFYENAWAKRASLLEECINNGMNTYQAISTLETKERRYRLEANNEGNEPQWRELIIDEENTLKLTKAPGLKHSSTMGNLLILPFYAKMDVAELIIDVFEANKPFDSIIELGCGYGRNLFNIFYKGGPLDIPYFGGEFTQSGVEIATKLATATPNMNVKFFHFNHLTPDVSQINGGKRALVFTSHTIEQVKLIPDEWFKVVASIAPHVTCVHREPFGFQVKELGDVTRRHRDFFLEQGWNLNFYETLTKAVRNGDIILDETILEYGSFGDPYNPSSLAFWHKDSE